MFARRRILSWVGCLYPARMQSTSPFIDRIVREEDWDVRYRMLVHLGRVSIPLSQPMDALIEMTKETDKQIRDAVIFALGCQDSDICREELRKWVTLPDHKEHRDEILQAQAALDKIGREEDIPLIERNIRLSSRHIRESARFVSAHLRQMYVK